MSFKSWRKKIVMARPKSNNVQINISVPSEWKTELENLARIYSVEEGKTMIDEKYNKLLKQYHKVSERHILAVESDMPYSDILQVVTLSDKIRKAGNELVALMRKNYEQLLRTKRYRKLLVLYGNTGDKNKRKA